MSAKPTAQQERLREAFDHFAWLGWTFDQAMANPFRRYLIEDSARRQKPQGLTEWLLACKARQLRSLDHPKT